MSKRGPILTLGIIGLLALGILIANSFVGSNDESTKTSVASSVASSSVTTTVRAVTTTKAAIPPAPAPADTGFPAQADYSGDAGPIALSITVTGADVVAYACDGNTVESWLRGKAENGKVKLTSKAGDELTGQLAGNTVSGNLRVQGAANDFRADLVQPPAGIYRYADNGTTYSWVYQGDGDVTGVVKAPDGSTSPAPTLDSDGVAVINGVSVQAVKVSK